MKVVSSFNIRVKYIFSFSELFQFRETNTV